METVLLDSIGTASYQCALKKKKNVSTLVNFCAAILMLKIKENKQHFQYIMLYYFKRGKNTAEMQKKKICAVYGEGAVTDPTCQKWFCEVSC